VAAAAVALVLEERRTDLVLLHGRIVGLDSATSRFVALRKWVRTEKRWRAS
jgi:hypothetical protein